MSLTPDALVSVVGRIWAEVLGFRVRRTSGVGVPEQSVTAAVSIEGCWRGTVVIRVSPELAARAAEALFGRPGGTLSREESEDLVAELASITGGNLKATLPGVNRMSLPRMLSPYQFRPAGEQAVADEHFAIEDGWLAVTVFSRAALAADLNWSRA